MTRVATDPGPGHGRSRERRRRQLPWNRLALPPPPSLPTGTCSASDPPRGPANGDVEEGLSRGALLERLRECTTPGRAIVGQAALSSMAHLGYFPLPSHGIFYAMLFVLGLVWGWTAYRFGLIAAAIAHGGLVFLTVPAALP